MGNTDSKFKDYRKIAKLGCGTFSNVFTAMKGKNIFVLKEIVLARETVAHMKREMEKLRRLEKHECVVQMAHLYMSKDVVKLLLEYCHLGTLNEYVQLCEPGWDVLAYFMLDMTQGLGHLHSTGIVHRNVNPDNILLVRSRGSVPRCKLTNLGFAGHASKDGFSCSKSSLFCSPEGARGEYTKYSDMFSLGVVFYAIHTREGLAMNGYLSPVLETGMAFYLGTEQEICHRVCSSISDGKTDKLICSMLTTTFHRRADTEDVVKSLQYFKDSRKMKIVLPLCGLFLLAHVVTPDVLFLVFTVLALFLYRRFWRRR